MERLAAGGFGWLGHRSRCLVAMDFGRFGGNPGLKFLGRGGSGNNLARLWPQARLPMEVVAWSPLLD